MKILRNISSIITITLIIFIATSNIRIQAFTNIDVNNEILNAGVLLYTYDDLYMLKLKESLGKIQSEKGDNINFTFYDGKNNPSVQSETLDSLLKDGLDLLIVTLADQRDLVVRDVIFKAKQKNIPLILIGVSAEIISKVSNDYNRVVFITPDLQQPGIIEGNLIVNLWNSNKKSIDKDNNDIIDYIILNGKTNSPIAIERTKNSISTINNSGIKTHEIQLVYANWSKELAKNSIENLFLRYGNKIEAIIANNDTMAIGAIEALQKYGYNKGDKSKYIAVVGIDGLPEAKDLIDKGYMSGTVEGSVNAFAEGLYTVGLNLIKALNPIENTNYQISNGEIVIPLLWHEYTK